MSPLVTTLVVVATLDLPTTIAGVPTVLVGVHRTIAVVQSTAAHRIPTPFVLGELAHGVPTPFVAGALAPMLLVPVLPASLHFAAANTGHVIPRAVAATAILLLLPFPVVVFAPFPSVFAPLPSVLPIVHEC